MFLGKVHGSLARAGKVKAQTPKVNLLFTLIVVILFVYLNCVCFSSLLTKLMCY